MVFDVVIDKCSNEKIAVIIALLQSEDYWDFPLRAGSDEVIWQ